MWGWVCEAARPPGRGEVEGRKRWWVVRGAGELWVVAKLTSGCPPTKIELF